MSRPNFEKSVALGAAITTVFGVLSSLNPYLAYSVADYFIDRLGPFPISWFQPIPFTYGLMLSSFGGMLGLVATVQWRRVPRSILRLRSLLACAGLLLFMLEFSSSLSWIMEKYMILFIPEVIIVPGVRFYFVLFGSLLMLERATMGGILRRITVGTSATSLALLVLVLCMFFSPALDLAYSSFLTIVGLQEFLGGLLAVIGTVISLVLIRRQKSVKIFGARAQQLV